jgi:CBS domain-containing protein
MAPVGSEIVNVLGGSATDPAATPVRHVMSSGVIALSSDTTIGACASAMHERHTHAVLIVDRTTRQPQGWVRHSDILEHIESDPLTTIAGQAISQDVSLIAPDATVREAADLMLEKGVSHLLVASSLESIPEGVISSWDIVSFYAGSYGRAP